jgi:hypothetical protein
LPLPAIFPRVNLTSSGITRMPVVFVIGRRVGFGGFAILAGQLDGASEDQLRRQALAAGLPFRLDAVGGDDRAVFFEGHGRALPDHAPVFEDFLAVMFESRRSAG